MNKKAYLSFFLFGYFWLIPLFYFGVTKNQLPFTPGYLGYFYNSTALFTNSVTSWPQYFIQFQFEENGAWILDTESTDSFRMKPFGQRTRFTRFMEIFRDDERNRPVRQELAQWLIGQFKNKHPDRRPPVAVRFVTARRSLQGLNKSFQGAWKHRPFESFAPAEIFTSEPYFPENINDF